MVAVICKSDFFSQWYLSTPLAAISSSHKSSCSGVCHLLRFRTFIKHFDIPLQESKGRSMVQKYHEKKLKLNGLVKEIVPWWPFYDVYDVIFFKHPCISSTLTSTPVAKESIHDGGCEVLTLQIPGFYQQKCHAIHVLPNACSFSCSPWQRK